MCFPVNFAKFLRTPFLQNTSWRLLLVLVSLLLFLSILLNVNNGNTKKCEIYWQLTVKVPERPKWLRSCVFIVNFEHYVIYMVAAVSFYFYNSIRERTLLQFFLDNCLWYSEELFSRILPELLFYGSSRPEVFCKKHFITNFAKFPRKHLYQSLFFNKVFLKRIDSGTGVFLQILRNL